MLENQHNSMHNQPKSAHLCGGRISSKTPHFCRIIFTQIAQDMRGLHDFIILAFSLQKSHIYLRRKLKNVVFTSQNSSHFPPVALGTLWSDFIRKLQTLRRRHDEVRKSLSFANKNNCATVCWTTGRSRCWTTTLQLQNTRGWWNQQRKQLTYTVINFHNSC